MLVRRPHFQARTCQCSRRRGRAKAITFAVLPRESCVDTLPLDSLLGVKCVAMLRAYDIERLQPIASLIEEPALVQGHVSSHERMHSAARPRYCLVHARDAERLRPREARDEAEAAADTEVDGLQCLVATTRPRRVLQGQCPAIVGAEQLQVGTLDEQTLSRIAVKAHLMALPVGVEALDRAASAIESRSRLKSHKAHSPAV
mmetsp:Transcript_26092/g.82129  ORF Transcript_26092/g.82129 Transcript_26092/m.82129 type:complete len:202 (-) Transcript_26092:743-1348(-)